MKEECEIKRPSLSDNTNFIKGVVGRRKSIGQVGLWSQSSVTRLEEKLI